MRLPLLFSLLLCAAVTFEACAPAQAAQPISNGGATYLTAQAAYSRFVDDTPVCLTNAWTPVPPCNYNDAGPCINTRSRSSTELVLYNTGATTEYCSPNADAGAAVVPIASGGTATFPVQSSTVIGCYLASGFQDGGPIGCTDPFDGVP